MKRGISLIAVLMFMLAATTASIVVFRMIGSENFSSGSRLKMSESEAAANSGLDAVHAWMENRAPEVGVLLSEFLKPSNIVNSNPRPMLIDNRILGDVGGNRNQKYNVYLIGADVSNRPYKLKFVSIGEARDNSVSNKVGYFGVEGLYKQQIPMIIPQAPFNQSLFQQGGENTTLVDGSSFSSAIINGDIKGNMPKITENLVVTGNATFGGGTNATCANDPSNIGELYIAGNLDPNGNFRACGNAYVGSITFGDNESYFDKNLFIEGKDIKGNENNTIGGGKIFNVGGNLTINEGTFSHTGKSEIAGDFVVLNESAVINFEPNSQQTFNVMGTSWILGDMNVNDQYGTNNVNFTLNNNGKAVYVKGSVTQEPDDAAGFNVYIKDDESRFRSKGEMAASNTMPEGLGVASNLPHLKERIVTDLTTGNKKIEDPIQAMDIDEWIASALDMPALCRGKMGKADANADIIGLNPNQTLNLNSDVSGIEGFIDDLNACYAKLTDEQLHNGYFPLIIDNVSLVNLTAKVLRGNFFFIFINSGTFELPNTGKNSYAMIYFLNASHTSAEINGTDTEQSRVGFPAYSGGNFLEEKGSNFFIFSERNINTINGGKFDGSIFMANGTSVGRFQGGINVNFNEAMYNSLVSAGVLELTEAGQKLAGIGEENSLGNNIYDYRYTPLSPRLKVTAENSYESNENFSGLVPTNNLKQAVLVMPRIVHIPEDIPDLGGTGHEFDNYFSVLYLNGSNEPIDRSEDDWRGDRGTTSCKTPDGTAASFTEGSLAKGYYKCTFTTTGITPALIDTFYVSVVKELGTSKLGFGSPSYKITEDSPNLCATVTLSYNPGNDVKECNATISAQNLKKGWKIISHTGTPTTIGDPPSLDPWTVGPINNSTYPASGYSFQVCANNPQEDAAKSIDFQIESTDCQLEQRLTTVTFSGTITANITRERDADSEAPDCDIDILEAPTRTNSEDNVAWGAFKLGFSGGTCEALDEEYEYECKSDEEAGGYQVWLELADAVALPPECEFLPDDPTTRLEIATSRPQTITADIKRKSYTLEITKEENTTVDFESTDIVDINIEDDDEGTDKISQSCGTGATCTITLYAGIIYNVKISTEDVYLEIDEDLDYTGFADGGNINTIAIATDSYENREERIMVITPLTPKNIVCAVGDYEIVAGQTLDAGTISSLVNANATVLDGCDNPKVIYKLDNGLGTKTDMIGWEAVEGEDYQVYANITCDDGSTVIFEEASCGFFDVIEAKASASCAIINSSYAVGSRPQFKLTINNGSRTDAPRIADNNGFPQVVSGSYPVGAGASSELTIEFDEENSEEQNKTYPVTVSWGSGAFTIQPPITCGPIDINSVPTLICDNIGDIRTRPGIPVTPGDPLPGVLSKVRCSVGSDPDPGSVKLLDVVSDALLAYNVPDGTVYDNIKARANCGSYTDLEAQCEGTITVTECDDPSGICMSSSSSSEAGCGFPGELPCSSSSAGGGGTGTVAMDDGVEHQIEGDVTLTCATQFGLNCWADPMENLNIGCATLKSTHKVYVGCGVNGQGGSRECTVPAGKTVICQKSN